ncbi:heme exporter protein CcmD [Meridianimarinicoccus aquatilis]|uniref:Heme exporter protein D n=1 Tax=Meridianimarinicoccus aquatilis TaxID=2552766 RepID=A0A4R6ATF8_9RHOB|nr:heme exporter protein CcmD [Fluviibacterium aquatile]QIE42209.1 heme exporter protein CcmD [Rhodobacteraceae bacterium SC52]TDL86804.1 heme exporter protein CcmD [Fluviibacterium aquatile]
MIPDLGKYAAEVASAYAVSLVMIAGLVWFSLRQSAKVRAELRRIEAKREQKNG